ncbi:MAG: hypothetical protein ACR2RV_09250 [Verrucomicrobiales bacterium]
MKNLVWLLLISLGTTGFALDAEEMKALAEKPHDRSGLIEEMKFFPDTRVYSAELRIGLPGEEVTKVKDITVDEKTVEGRFIVSELNHPDAPERPILMVVTFDQGLGVYRKWVMIGDGAVSEFVGSVVPGTRSISWGSLVDVDGMRSVGNEHHTDDLVRWREVIIKDGKVISIQRGSAKRVR